MGKSYDGITPELSHWIERQHIFFVATVLIADDGLINCSPKGMDTFRILGPRDVAYLDLTGSGIETGPFSREWADCVHVLRVRRPAKDRPAPRNGRCALPRLTPVRLAQLFVSCVRRQSCDRPCASHADQRFVRI